MACFNTPRSNRRDGGTLVEMAVVIVAFFLVLFGIIEFGRMVMVKNILDNAAREGARYSTSHGAPVTLVVNGTTMVAGATDADVIAVVNQRMSGVVGQLKNVQIEVFAADHDGNPLLDANGSPLPWTDAAFGEYIGVRIKADYVPLLPSLLHIDPVLKMEALSVMCSEAN